MLILWYFFQIMSKTLRIFHKVPSLEKKLLVGQQDVMDLVIPSTTINLEKALLQPKLRNEHVCSKSQFFVIRD